MRSRVTAALAVLLAVSVGLNVFLGSRANDYYRLLGLAKLRPRPAEVSDPQPVDVVYLGDSRIADWSPLPTPEGKSSLKVGENGATTAMVLDRMRHEVLVRTPAVVVVQAGINDLKVIGMFPDLEDAVVDTCAANLNTIVAELTGAGCQVLLLTVLPGGDSVLRRWLLWPDAVDDAIARINQGLLALEGEAVEVVDCAAEMASSGRIEATHARDFLHLSPRGYERLNDVVRGPLEELARR